MNSGDGDRQEPPGAPDHGGENELAAVGARLDAVEELPVTERPPVYAEVNDAIVRELSAMEEV